MLCSISCPSVRVVWCVSAPCWRLRVRTLTTPSMPVLGSGDVPGWRRVPPVYSAVGQLTASAGQETHGRIPASQCSMLSGVCFSSLQACRPATCPTEQHQPWPASCEECLRTLLWPPLPACTSSCPPPPAQPSQPSSLTLHGCHLPRASLLAYCVE